MIGAIFTWLKDDATVSGYVGTKIFPNVIPDGQDSPAIVYQLVGGHPENYLGENPTIDRGVYQITAWSVAPTTARDLCKAARTVMEQHGMVVPGSYGMDFDKDTNMHGFRFDVSVWDNR